MSLTKNDLDVIIYQYVQTYYATASNMIAHYIKSEHPLLKISIKELTRLITQQRKTKIVPQKSTGHYTVVIGCTHIPFHNKKQFDATAHLINWLSSHVTTDFVADGDILDMNSISRHNKGKVAKQPGLNLGIEYQLANEELDKIDWSKVRDKTYLYGNHETWYYLHMAEVDNAKLGEGAVKSPHEALGLEEKGFKVLTNYGQDKHRIGDLLVVHGYLVNKHSAMAHLEVYKQNVLFFHTHRKQTYTDSGPNETQITAYNGGFGGDRKMVAFNYMDEGSKTKWNNSIVVTYTNELDHTTVEILDWIDDRFIFMGHQFTAEGVKSLI